MRRPLQAVTLFVSSVVLSLALCEVATRVVCGQKFGKRPGFYEGDDLLGWKPAPHLDHTFFGPDFAIHVRTDADRCRLGALGNVDHDKDLVVLCGDSFTFGWGVSTGETVASYLDQALYEESNGRVRVVNLAVGGYGLLQECDRLQVFLSAHPGARLAAVVVLHGQNDAADNLDAIGYHAGSWKGKTELKERSHLHLVNLVSYAGQRLEQARRSRDSGIGEVRHPFLQDVLWANRKQLRALLPDFVVVGRKEVSLVGRSSDDVDTRVTLARGSLTTMQRDMMLASIECIHGLLEGRRTKVLHAFVYTTAAWYVDEVKEIILESWAPEGVAVVSLGKVPGDGEYPGAYLNDHSGKHFTPVFNEFWAKRLREILEQHGIQ